MKLRALVLFVLVSLPLFASAQSVQVLTIGATTQPQNGAALPNTTVAVVAITLSAGTSPVTITSLVVEKIGSAGDSAIVSLDVRDSATNVIATANLTDSKVTFPLSISLVAGEKKTLLVSAKTASNLTSYQGQFFELDIIGVGTGAVLNGPLPMFGAQITLSTGVNRPTCVLAANPSIYSVGQTVTLSWNSTNATGGTITGLGSVSPSGSQGILPTGNSATYTASFTGPGGTGTCSTTVTRNTQGGIFGGGSAGGTTGGGSAGSVSTPGGPAPITPDPRTQLGTGGTNAVGDVCTGLNCQPCHFAALGQKVINWFLGFSIPLAAALFAYAGILYFTSAANPNNIQRAKRVFLKVLVGIIVVLGSWIALQTVLYIILTPEAYKSWNQLSCVSASLRPTNEKADKLFNALPTTPEGIIVGTDSVSANNRGIYSCDAGYTFVNEGGLFSCDKLDTNGDLVDSKSPICGAGYTSTEDGGCKGIDGNIAPVQAYSSAAGVGCAAAYQEQLNSACSQYGLGDCSIASAVMVNESSCRPGLVGPTSDYGLMQVTCGAAQSYDPTGWARNQSCDAIKNRLLTDTDYNIAVGVNELRACYNNSNVNGDIGLTAACYNGGTGAVRPSTSCDSGYVYQCTAVRNNYGATRNYVPSVVRTYNTLNGR